MTRRSEVRLTTIPSMVDVGAADWNRVSGGQPFMRHEFLLALEESGCVGQGTPWQSCHLLAHANDGRLEGALPLYRKFDSRGEFVFDWSWADAYERAGMAYYPKLVCAAPYTPATGPRILLAPDAGPAVAAELVRGAIETAETSGVSSLHFLFPAESDRRCLRDAGLLERKGCQFHWTNAQYASFDDFLGRFSSAKRKKARRERRRIAEAGITFEHLQGNEPSSADWNAIYEYYARTFHRRGREPYLNRRFFELIAASMPEQLIVILARHHRQPIAVALCLRGPDALFGRYWGSLGDFHSLHFEACYYQGIEYCIRHGLARFEPGTQGEHKISRGFSPTPTWSYHWLREPAFRDAVEHFLGRETFHVDAYIDELSEHVPYKSAEAAADDR